MHEYIRNYLSRREFLAITTFGSLTGAMAIAGLGIARFFVPRVFPEPSKHYKIGDPAAFPIGENRIPPGRSVHVFHDENGFYAISSKCTHLGCIVKLSSHNGFSGRNQFQPHKHANPYCHEKECQHTDQIHYPNTFMISGK